LPTSSVPVLYIAGTGRSGSTLLANVLGSVDGVFAAGELRFAWERGLADGALCASRLPVAECPVWTEVFDRAFGGFAQVDAGELQTALADRTRMRNLPRVLRDRGTPERVPEHLARSLQAMYEAIMTTTGSRLIIDTSKLPTYALLLSELPGIDVRILHLVRDPRAAAWSWMRRRATGTVEGYEETMDRFSSAKSASLWSIWNASTRRLWRLEPDRYKMVRYEDFVTDPEGVTAQILKFAGLHGARVAFDGPRTVRLSPSHAIAGNPNRMRYGETRIDADSEWESSMPAKDRIAVSALTAPLLSSFGYGIRT
jgi:hypothetical protein